MFRVYSVVRMNKGFSMPERRGSKTSHGDEQFLLIVLSNGPLCREEISNMYGRVGGLFAITTPVPGTSKYQKWQGEIDDNLKHLLECGLIVKSEGAIYRLTEQGIEEANILNQGVQKFTGSLRTFFLNGKTTAKISIIVNAILALLKLLIGFSFNSMALIADGFDNVVDVVSAIVVFLGIKYRKELLSSLFILLVMFITGILIGYEAIIRFIHTETVEAGFFTIAAAVISGLICYLMSIYQYTVGKNTGSLSLISQSIDSRNHVFVAGAVLISMIFAAFGIFIVDSIVGLAVAILILKSAIELAIETSKIAGGEEMDVNRFATAEERAYKKLRSNYFKSWLLFYLKETKTKEEILSRYSKNFSTEDIPMFSHFSFLKGFDPANHVDSLLQESINEGLVTITDGGYRLTDKGYKLLKSRLASQRYM